MTGSLCNNSVVRMFVKMDKRRGKRKLFWPRTHSSGGISSMLTSYGGGYEGEYLLLLLRLGARGSSGSRERDDVDRPP